MPSTIKKVFKWSGIVFGIVVLIAIGLGIYIYTLIPKPIGEKPVLQSELFTKPERELPVAGKFVYKSATELAAMIKNKQATSAEIVQEHINYIKNNNYKTNAFVWLFEQDALDAAKKADEKVAKGEPLRLLEGIPVSIKEEFAVKGKPHTWNAEMFQGVIAPKNSGVVDAMINEGAIILGTTNVPKMLFDVQTIGEIYPTANNPYDLTRTPGGSTGGGAATVASGFVPITMGGDFGGSIRIPAADCGLYGLKTTDGATPDFGGSPGEPGDPKYHRMMVPGPLARTVDDIDLAWNAMMNKWPEQKAKMLEPKGELKDYKIAYLDEWKFGSDKMLVSKDIKDALEKFTGTLSSNNVSVANDQPADFDKMVAMHRLLTIYVAFEKVPWLFRQFVIRDFKSADNHRIDMAEVYDRMSDLDPAKYDDILKRHNALRDQMEAFLTKYDFLILPVASTVAIKHNPEHTPISVDGTNIDYWDNFLYPVVFNATGHPSLTVPLGLNADGLPIAVQIVGPLNSEKRLIAFAKLIEPLHTGHVKPGVE
ncbi:MAG: amidase [Chloracidobacterium sp.]|nr:amidase [Chloracidobacterium sp.]